MTNIPNVVIMNKFIQSYNNLNNYYQTKEKVYNSTMNMFDYYADIKKKAFFMLDYFSGKIGKDKEMNIMFENGEYATKEEIEKRKKKYSKYIENSNIYKLVISFPENYLEQNVDIKQFEKNLAKKIIPMFLKKCGFEDIKKMSYQFSLHTNTDHTHFHFSFAEKSPNTRGLDKKLKYRFKGELTQEELSFLKNEIEHFIEKEKVFTPLLKETNEQIEKLKTYFNKDDKNYLLSDKDDLILEDKIIKLGELLDKERSDNRKIKYGSINNKEIISLTKEIKKYLFKNDDMLKDDYRNFKNSLNRINYYFENISKKNNIDFIDKSLINRKRNYIDNYIYNSIVNHAIYNYRKKRITEEEIIQEVVYKNYKNNSNYTRFNILTNYLTSKNFVNKYRIREAVKNINDELEEAQRDFEKLFQSDNEIKQ